ncbi:MAG: MoxR family ATPase [Phycisphaerales bacterium]|nr:MoxR family ATPase [Phycisphaerales bacterium]
MPDIRTAQVCELRKPAASTRSSIERNVLSSEETMTNAAGSPPTPANIETQVADFKNRYQAIEAEIGKVIVGHKDVVAQTVLCLMIGGHALLEGVPGLGKTMLVRTLAQVMDLHFSRIQFTPDLMPADIVGTSIVSTDDRGNRSWQFQPGPIFGNLILADEINRATPKTQSALLEAMAEQSVSVAKTTHKLTDPFFVLATQNPLEMEGTYPLPEAQLDRFAFKISIESPALQDLLTILDRTTGVQTPKPSTIVNAEQIITMKHLVRAVPVASHVKDYICRLVLATHPDAGGGGGGVNVPEITKKFIRFGASPRGAQAIILAAKVLALRDGRYNVSFADVRSVLMPCLRHRIILNFEGQAEGLSTDSVIKRVIDATPEVAPV